MGRETDTELLASIPYEKDKAIEYYDDCIVFNRSKIFYDDIAGYGYSLTSFSQSIYFIPTYNSKTVSLSFSLGNDTKPETISIKAEMAFGFHTQRQADLELIFAEIIRITDVILAQLVLDKLYARVRNGESLNIGGLIIEDNSIRRKGMFKEKELEQYGRTYTQAGQVVVEDGDGRRFFSTTLGNINAPLLGFLLDALFKI